MKEEQGMSGGKELYMILETEKLFKREVIKVREIKRDYVSDYRGC